MAQLTFLILILFSTGLSATNSKTAEPKTVKVEFFRDTHSGHREALVYMLKGDTEKVWYNSDRFRDGENPLVGEFQRKSRSDFVNWVSNLKYKKKTKASITTPHQFRVFIDDEEIDESDGLHQKVVKRLEEELEDKNWKVREGRKILIQKDKPVVEVWMNGKRRQTLPLVTKKLCKPVGAEMICRTKSGYHKLNF